MDQSCKKASDFLKVILNGLIDEKISKADSVLRLWKKAVGEKIASHSRIIDISNGNLLIETDHPGWSQQILFRKKRILEDLNRSIPEFDIKNLLVRIRSSGERRNPENEGKTGEFFSGLAVQKDEPDQNDIPDYKETGNAEDLSVQFAKLRKILEKRNPPPGTAAGNRKIQYLIRSEY